MALTAFASGLGRFAGRVHVEKASAGAYAFVLGSVEPGRYFELAPGDHAEVTQATDLTSVQLVRALLQLRAPASTPPSYAWEASIIVDGAAFARVRAWAGRARVVNDLAANVSKLSGVHIVGVRLALVSA